MSVFRSVTIYIYFSVEADGVHQGSNTGSVQLPVYSHSTDRQLMDHGPNENTTQLAKQPKAHLNSMNHVDEIQGPLVSKFIDAQYSFNDSGPTATPTPPDRGFFV